jgi:hypothetical protein
MEKQGDGKDFGHHLEMAKMHHASMDHHLQQMSEMHGLQDADSADAGENDSQHESVGKAMPFEGKETANEETAEGREPDHVNARKRRR